MTRIVPLSDVSKGIQNDNPQPGTMRECVNLLPWNGSLRRRGPAVSSDTFGTTVESLSTPAEAIHAKGLPSGEHTVFAFPYDNAGTPYSYIFCDASYTYVESIPRVARMFSIGREIVALPDAASQPVVVMSGSTNAVAYSGTAACTAGSKHVTLSAAIADSVAERGYINFNVSGYRYPVEAALSTTTLKLSQPALSTVGGTVSWAAYASSLYLCSDSPAGGGLFNQANGGGAGLGSNSGKNSVMAQAGCAHQERVFFGNTTDFVYSGTAGVLKNFPSRIRWSGLPDDASSAPVFEGNRYFNSDAYLDLDDAGGEILGLESFNGALVVIRRQAVQVITGSFATDGSRTGASVNTVARSVGASGHHAWESFEEGIAFADEKGVYVWDGSQVTNLTRGAVERTYRQMVSGNAENIIVQTPGNRIMVHAAAAPSGDLALVFDFNVGGWFRIQLANPYSRMVDTGTGYLALVNDEFDLGGGDLELRSHDLRGVFEDLDNGSAAWGEDADAGSAVIECYLLTNPVPIGDGWGQGRVTEIALADGGAVADAADVNYNVKLIRGPIYAEAPYSGDVDVTSQDLTDIHSIPPIVGSEVDQRIVKTRVNGSADATHAMVQVQHGAATTGVTYAYGLSGIALSVDDNPGYPSV